MRAFWIEIRAGRDVLPVTVMGKTDSSWRKINLMYYQSNQTMLMRNKPNLKNTSPHHSLFPGLNFSPDFLYPLLPSGTGDREWWLKSVHHTFSAIPSSSAGRTPYTEATPVHALLPKTGQANPVSMCIDSLVRAVWC